MLGGKISGGGKGRGKLQIGTEGGMICWFDLRRGAGCDERRLSVSSSQTPAVRMMPWTCELCHGCRCMARRKFFPYLSFLLLPRAPAAASEAEEGTDRNLKDVCIKSHLTTGGNV